MIFLSRVGKTALSALTGKILSDLGKKILYVDADPARGLASALEVFDIKTIGKTREEIIKQAKEGNTEEETENFANNIDYLVMESLYEAPDFSLIVMGQTDTLGCFCPLNNILRDTITAISSQYEYIIIDAEAGIEQVNRQVVESVDYPVIVTDNSMRGVRTSFMINDIISTVPKMNPEKIGIIFNRVKSAESLLTDKIKEKSLDYYGSVSPDPVISELDLHGRSIMNINEDAISHINMKEILIKEGIIS